MGANTCAGGGGGGSSKLLGSASFTTQATLVNNQGSGFTEGLGNATDYVSPAGQGGTNQTPGNGGYVVIRCQ